MAAIPRRADVSAAPSRLNKSMGAQTLKRIPRAVERSSFLEWKLALAGACELEEMAVPHCNTMRVPLPPPAPG